MKKRWLSLVLALAFCLSLAPGVTLTAKAESATDTTYPLYIAGTQVTSANAGDLSVIDGVTVGEDGYAKYISTDNTLKIKNATITNSTAGDSGFGIQYTGDTGTTFTLEAAGTNTVSVTGKQTQSSAAVAVGTPENWPFPPLPQASLRVYLLDDATLNLSGGTAEGDYYPSSYGIVNAYDGQVTVTGAGTVNAAGGAATYSYGVHSTGEFFKTGTCTLNATGADSVLYSCGLYGGDNVTITAGTLSAVGGTVLGDGAASYGINGDTSSSDTITITNGVEVLAKGNTVALHKAPTLSSGVIAGGSTNLDGSGAVVYTPADNNSYKWFRAPFTVPVTTYDPETGVLTVTLPDAPTEDVLLIASAYSETGQMTDVSVRSLTNGDEITQHFTGLDAAYLYKAFLVSAGGDETTGGSFTPVAPSGGGAKNYDSLVTARGQVYLPALDGAVAHSTVMAIDAYVEADMAKDKVLSLFAETGATVEEGDSTVKVTRLAEIAKNGTDAEKAKALAQVSAAKSAMEQSVLASAVLDAAAGTGVTLAEAQVRSYTASLMASDRNSDEALKWAQEISAKWDSLQAKGRLKAFAADMGVDARTAYQALSDAQDILNGKHMADAKFYDICTRVATGVKTASKVTVYVGATYLTAGATGGMLTVGEAVGMVAGGVDCAVETMRSGAKIILGDDHKIVQGVENSTATQVFDGVMFVTGVATFDPKSATTAEKILFTYDLLEKDVAAYENVKVLTDESTGLVIDKIENDTKKIAAEYTRIEAKDPADLAPAAEQALGADNTGITGVDTTLSTTDGQKEQQKKEFTRGVDSGSTELARTYGQVKSGDTTFSDQVTSFMADCDKNVKYVKLTSGGDDPGPGPGPGGGGGGSSGGGINLPTPVMDYDDMTEEVWDNPDGDDTSYCRYYKDGKPVGETTYAIDANGRYWPVEDRWYCGGGEDWEDWLCTLYYHKGETLTFEWTDGYLGLGHSKELTADRYGLVYQRYGEHITYNQGDYIMKRDLVWFDTIKYFPSGQVYDHEQRSSGHTLNHYIYSPEGLVMEHCTDYDETNAYSDTYTTYYVYPVPDCPFDPTGHPITAYRNGWFTNYWTGSTEEDGHTTWGYFYEKVDSAYTDRTDGFIPMT